MEIINAKDAQTNPALKEVVETENDLKNFLVEYVGSCLEPENNEVTVEMIIETMAKEFPEFIFAIAEENWIRGYQQALEDVDSGYNMVNKDDKQKKDCRICKKPE
jgi:hypothetical protein